MIRYYNNAKTGKIAKEKADLRCHNLLGGELPSATARIPLVAYMSANLAHCQRPYLISCA